MPTIDVEATSTTETRGPQPATMAVATRGQMGVGKAMTVEELHERLEFIRNVMKKEMREGQDYGKIPGTGDKPSLLQPGAQKLLMTFNFREQVKKEVLRELPHSSIFGHREYEFTVVVFPAGLRPEDGWDGVGTCSTMESKYRYRKATRKCPKCGQEAIIEEKPEFVRGREPGFVCWKKRNGCGEVFHKEHPDILSQSLDDVENEDPADQWNTVRKMAFKRALVAAAINATNTSELWTQDIEDMTENKGRQKAGSGQKPPHATKENALKPSQTHFDRPGGMSTPPDNRTPQATGKAATPAPSPATRPPQQAIFADNDTRDRMIRAFKDCEALAHEYFIKAGCILETEKLEDLPLRFVPVTRRQFQALEGALAGFGNGEEAKLPYAPNPEPEPVKLTRQPETSADRFSKAANTRPPEKDMSPKASAVVDKEKRNPEWFFNIVCPIPNKGQKRDAYLKAPDSILSLYRRMKEGDESAQKRLWGFAKHWEPSERQVGNKIYPISEEDRIFREALDAFCEWEEKHGKDSQQEEDDLRF